MDELIKEIRVIAQQQTEIKDRISVAIAKETTKLEELQERDKVLREKLLTAMERNNVKKFQNDVLRITYIPAQVRTVLDTDRIKEEAPEIYTEFGKESKVKASLRISVYESDKE